MSSSLRLALFAPNIIGDIVHRALLLQFLLSDLLEGYRAVQEGLWSLAFTQHPCFFSYDWSNPVGALNKMQEHALCLPTSFPHQDQASAIQLCDKLLNRVCTLFLRKTVPSLRHFNALFRALLTSFEPLMTLCKEDENLFFFLLKHRHALDILAGPGYLHHFLQTLYPDGLQAWGEKMCDQYHQRGFFSQIPECRRLLTELRHA